MTSSDSIFKSYLKNRSISITPQRMKVFEQLGLIEPCGLKELIDSIGPQINRATIYRIIKLYEAIGVINKINIGFKYKIELSEKFNPHHHHLYCLSCHKIIDIKSLDKIEETIAEIAEDYHFEIKNHQIEINGYCLTCIKKLRFEKNVLGSVRMPHTS